MKSKSTQLPAELQGSYDVDRTQPAMNESFISLGQDEDMSIDYVGDLLPESFTVEQIALTFIKALSDQALQDFSAPVSRYTFIDSGQLQNPVRLVMDPAPGANRIRLIRSNLIWCLRYLPIRMFGDPSIWGVNFVAKFRGQNLYFGKLDNRNRRASVLQLENQSAIGGPELSQNERAGTGKSSNGTLVPLSIGQVGDSHISIDFPAYTGDRLVGRDIFRALIEVLFLLAPRDKMEAASYISLSDPMPVWIFVICDESLPSGRQLEVQHVITLLNILGQRFISEHIYEELIFRLVVGGEPFAAGCVTKKDESRRWCSGMLGAGPPLLLNSTGDPTNGLILSL